MEIQRITYSILREFSKFCDENKLNYFLAYGTLLGAVRHKGFIPWDDDIDVWMPREDYMKLLKYLKKYDLGKYKLCSGAFKEKGEWPEELQMKNIDTSVRIERSFGNDVIISYPWINIFSLDNSSSNRLRFYYRFKYHRFYYQLCRCKSFYIKSKGIKSIINYLIYTLYNKFHLLKHVLNEEKSTKYFVNLLLSEHLLNKQNIINDFFCNAAVYIPNFKKCYFKSEWFANKKLIQFEDDYFYVPEGYDKILKHIYGDYNVLPPVHMRKGTHFGRIIKN